MTCTWSIDCQQACILLFVVLSRQDALSSQAATLRSSSGGGMAFFAAAQPCREHSIMGANTMGLTLLMPSFGNLQCSVPQFLLAIGRHLQNHLSAGSSSTLHFSSSLMHWQCVAWKAGEARLRSGHAGDHSFFAVGKVPVPLGRECQQEIVPQLLLFPCSKGWHCFNWHDIFD